MLEYADRNSLQLLHRRAQKSPAGAAAALLIEAEFAEDTDLDRWEGWITESGAMAERSVVRNDFD
jgi:hypothetical protein